MYLAKVYITLKPTVNDPQGLTIKGGLHTLGFNSVESVRSGKYLEIKADASAPMRSNRYGKCAGNFWQTPSLRISGLNWRKSRLSRERL